MEVDAALLEYGADLITETGAVYRLDEAVQSLSWEEQDGQLAQKAVLSLADCKVEGDTLRSLLKLNRIIRICADWGAGRQVMFEGAVWEWQYVHAQSREISITAYDPMIRLQQSKDMKYFSAGLTTPAILGMICREWGIPLDYQWAQQITHEKKVFNGEAVSDIIIKLLEEVRQQTGIRYAVLCRDGRLLVSGLGTNQDIYKFTGSNSINVTTKLSINELVTRVKVIGKADNEGRAGVEAVVDGNLEFGILQEIVKRDGDKDIGRAKAEAETLLKEKGKPEESILLNSPDLPFLRRGDAVEVEAGNLSGIFYVLGVSHNATEKQMTMTLLRQPDIQEMSAGKHSTADFKKGDAIILNGPVYVDSYGNGRGRTFTDYKSTITIVAPSGRACPYHIGQIGWVYPDEIAKRY